MKIASKCLINYYDESFDWWSTMMKLWALMNTFFSNCIHSTSFFLILYPLISLKYCKYFNIKQQCQVLVKCFTICKWSYFVRPFDLFNIFKFEIFQKARGIVEWLEGQGEGDWSGSEGAGFDSSSVNHRSNMFVLIFVQKVIFPEIHSFERKKKFLPKNRIFRKKSTLPRIFERSRPCGKFYPKYFLVRKFKKGRLVKKLCKKRFFEENSSDPNPPLLWNHKMVTNIGYLNFINPQFRAQCKKNCFQLQQIFLSKKNILNETI